MIELIALMGLFIAGFAVLSVVGVVFFVFKLAMWTVFLPFRILFKMLWIPFSLIGGLFSLAAGAAILPIVLVVGLIAAVLALLVPMIPFLLFGLIVWSFMRRSPQSTVTG